MQKKSFGYPQIFANPQEGIHNSHLHYTDQNYAYSLDHRSYQEFYLPSDKQQQNLRSCDRHEYDPYSGYPYGYDYEFGDAGPQYEMENYPYLASYVTDDQSDGDHAFTGPVVTTYGTVSVFLQQYVRVDLTVDRAIRVVNFATKCVAAVNSTGDSFCILHPSGRVLSEGPTVHIETGNELVKMTKRGVVFTAMDHGLVYVVDASGTKSTTDRFKDLQQDYSVDLYYKGSFHGREAIPVCYSHVDNMFHNFYQYHRDEVWTIAGVRIKQGHNKDVRITRDFGRFTLRTSPSLGNVSLSTASIHMSASSDANRSFFVRKRDKTVSVIKGALMVRNGTQRAGFDTQGKLVLS